MFQVFIECDFCVLLNNSIFYTKICALTKHGKALIKLMMLYAPLHSPLAHNVDTM